MKEIPLKDKQDGKQKVGYCWCGHKGGLLPRVGGEWELIKRLDTPRGGGGGGGGRLCVSVVLHDVSSQRASPFFLVSTKQLTVRAKIRVPSSCSENLASYEV